MEENKNSRKPRALHLSENDKKNILDKYEEGLKPAQIEKFFRGKYTYFQVYNTINPRPGSDKIVNEKSKLVEQKIKADKIVTEMPDVELGDFSSFEKAIEHQLAVIYGQLNSKNIRLNDRAKLIKQLSDINFKNKKLLMESYLKSGNANITIAIMQELKPDITDEEIILTFKRASEKVKQLNK
ncbi:MAG: hypothetical protein AB1394_13760 [Bacteroidota bacterium]